MKLFMAPDEVFQEWPNIFQDETLIETSDEKYLCAQALSAWAMVCGQRGEVPTNFGDVLAKVANRLGVSGTPDSFSDFAKEKGWIT
jgi:hypothetical protein